MVQLTVKGTKNLDEFVYVCTCAAVCGELAPKLAHVQNMRQRVRLQLYSCKELLPAAARANAGRGADLKRRFEEIDNEIRNPRTPVADEQYDLAWKELRDLTRDVFPNECQHKDGEQAAVDQLYALHDNPDIDDDYRVHIYHCRAIMDPENRPNEMVDEAKCCMWFSGNAMASDDTIGKYCGNNEKSRITVKIAPRDGQAPSKEPRLDYDAQRELHRHFAAKRETMAALEESELREKALARQRAERKAAVTSAPVAGEPRLNLEGVRPIYSGAQVTLRDASE